MNRSYRAKLSLAIVGAALVLAGCERPPMQTAQIGYRGMTPDGKAIEREASGLHARVVQHEVDHLNGILFIDRMDRKSKNEIRDELDALQTETKAALEATKPKR